MKILTMILCVVFISGCTDDHIRKKTIRLALDGKSDYIQAYVQIPKNNNNDKKTFKVEELGTTTKAIVDIFIKNGIFTESYLKNEPKAIMQNGKINKELIEQRLNADGEAIIEISKGMLKNIIISNKIKINEDGFELINSLQGGAFIVFDITWYCYIYC